MEKAKEQLSLFAIVMDQNGFLRQMTDCPDRQTKVPPHLYTQTILGNQLWNSDMHYLVSAVYRNPSLCLTLSFFFVLVARAFFLGGWLRWVDTASLWLGD